MNKMNLDAYENYNMKKALLVIGVLEEGIEKLIRENLGLKRKLEALESLDTRYVLTKSAEKELAAMGKENKK